METKHTPGPWRHDMNINHDGKFAGSFCIATDGKRVYPIAEVYVEANARLISAAPDLLAALENIELACAAVERNGYAHGEGWVSAHAKLGAYARAALARARGEG